MDLNNHILKTKIDVKSVKKQVEESMERLRPALKADGGDADVVDVNEEGVVTLKFIGACRGCSMSTMTLRNGIERVIKADIPEVTKVQATGTEF